MTWNNMVSPHGIQQLAKAEMKRFHKWSYSSTNIFFAMIAKSIKVIGCDCVLAARMFDVVRNSWVILLIVSSVSKYAKDIHYIWPCLVR
jgi:hypothetical protein